ncbi:MAG: ACT domain-containing protein, partial [Actinomycetota bacterium]|nr:ACT domain-containing protein [Actinomycetota bacterium]
RFARPDDLAEVRDPVPDRPGVLADVTTLATELDVNILDLEIAHSAEGDHGVLILVVDAKAAETLRAGLAARAFRPSAHPLG